MRCSRARLAAARRFGVPRTAWLGQNQRRGHLGAALAAAGALAMNAIAARSGLITNAGRLPGRRRRSHGLLMTRGFGNLAEIVRGGRAPARRPCDRDPRAGSSQKLGTLQANKSRLRGHPQAPQSQGLAGRRASLLRPRQSPSPMTKEIHEIISYSTAPSTAPATRVPFFDWLAGETRGGLCDGTPGDL
jgi:hypothetical protein